ncbi:hypothetical protein AVDCRST_MAG81-3550 [uncultured Synechococcales cyanobacterium]|uniref:Uncharacterized protein n=1 Tax=uncultured Synechococcales cyanobacterium TaxID=1936017 RepID=A0A6J4VQM4_9CYAN|nr:hypothetical protein AVDCRST_MAG81-3550 [uncultured Synechococcales cyanobacterium]
MEEVFDLSTQLHGLLVHVYYALLEVYAAGSAQEKMLVNRLCTEVRP